MSYIGNKPTIGNFQICDAISVVNGQAAYTMQVGSVNVTPQSANHMIVSLNGTIQKPNSSFTVSGSTITFASNLATGDVIDFIQILGDVLDLGVPSDATVTTAKLADNNVTTAKLAYNPNPNRNIIINGDMSQAQRGTSQASITSSGYYTVDRYRTRLGSIGTWTQSQSTDVPTGQGFVTSLKMDCTTANASPSAAASLSIQHKIEGQNLQYLKKGTSSAESTTLSFWVKSNKTGTYIAELFDNDNQRQISQTYTISSADTWEKKTLTFAGDTTGALGNDNGNSFLVEFWLGAGSNYTSGTLNTSWNSNTNTNRVVGSVNLADSTSNEWYITGVQLEAGTAASDFEFLPYDVNLQRCQRYYYLHASGDSQDVGLGGYYLSSHMFVNITLPTTMRTAPSVVYVSGTDYYKISRNGATDNFNDFSGGGSASLNEISLYNNSQVSGSGGDAGYIRTNNASASIALNSEL